MLDSFLKENGQFVNFGFEHLLCFSACLVLTGVMLHYGRKYWDADQQVRYVTILCFIGAATQLFKVFYRQYAGIFDQTNDVPLHLCNIMTLVMPFIMWFKWRFMWGVTFFWIMAGCAQSIFTPTLTESLPHYEAVRYWTVHGVIIMAALYGWYVLGYKPTVRDAVNSAIGLNLLAAVIYPVNLALGSNYMYLNGKPPGKTFYDLLGPWPQYILILEFVLVLFFAAILLPFYWKNVKSYLVSTKA